MQKGKIDPKLNIENRTLKTSVSEVGFEHLVIRKKWRKYPNDKPKSEGKCLVELHYQDDLGLQKFMWCVYWDGSEFRDYGGNTDISEGAKVKWFICEDDLNRPNK